MRAIEKNVGRNIGLNLNALYNLNEAWSFDLATVTSHVKKNGKNIHIYLNSKHFTN